MMRNLSLFLTLGLVAIMLLLTGCSSSQVVNTYLARGPAGPPTIVPSLPDEFVVVTITVSGGSFDTSSLQLPEDVPAILRVRNTDRFSYHLRFVHNLTEDLVVRAGTTTSVEFKTPRSGFYEGRLLSPPGTSRLDTLPIVIGPPITAPASGKQRLSTSAV
jgi:hypothetical protein